MWESVFEAVVDAFLDYLPWFGRGPTAARRHEAMLQVRSAIDRQQEPFDVDTIASAVPGDISKRRIRRFITRWVREGSLQALDQGDHVLWRRSGRLR